MSEIADIAVAPLVPWGVLIPVLAIGVAALVLALVVRARGAGWRALAMATLAVALLNPSLVREVREPIPDVAIVVADRSPSQELGGRRQQTDRAAAALVEQLERFDGLDVRMVDSGGQEGTLEEDTRLFETLEQALADIPRQRIAATFLITDGQVHDAPSGLGSNEVGPDAATQTGLNSDTGGTDAVDTTPGRAGSLGRIEGLGPVHTLLTGTRAERDRRLTLVQAPTFALVGQPATVTIKIEDLPVVGAGAVASVTLSRNGGEPIVAEVPVGVPTDLTFPVDHGGPSVIELQVAPVRDELTVANNRIALAVNGVRDRLRVLLVSGQPHAGERTWRSILKSDPAVDLVHFTILRPPEKQDGTPLGELSLISFPIRELFELRLYEFDLVIFDRYQRRGVLPSLYLANIAAYVEAGGAFLEASGPHFATPFSLYRTPLGSVLPGEPTGQVVERGFVPRPTDIGARHPVTADLVSGADRWGRWLRQIEVVSRDGVTVLDGPEGRPLLILDRVGDGRVAQLMSDHIWLWARNFEGGGPHAELLRRLAHWLMQEPELEENLMSARVAGGEVVVERRNLDDASGTAEIVGPTGQEMEIVLETTSPGHATGRFVATEPGIYRITDGVRNAFAVVGSANPVELSDMRATEERLAPVSTATRGGLIWLEDGEPVLRRVSAGRDAAGNGWLGVRDNGAYQVIGLRDESLMPAVVVLLLGLGGLMAAWFREGR